jgi:hypothetical protein
MVPGFQNVDRRVPSDKPLRLTWLDERGKMRCLSGRCIDFSSRRVHVEVRKRIPLHTSAMLRADGMKAGETSVKYVTCCERTFILVLDR